MNQPLRLEAGPLRITFQRPHDRYAHRVELFTAEGALPLLESIEGTPDDFWPPSPPWQELHVEDRPEGRRCALLVGRAGRSHWSAGVELDPSGGRIAFDIACRMHEPPAWLGSRYRLLQTLAPAAREPHRGLLLHGECGLQTELVDGHRATLEILADDRLSLAASPATGAGPRTVRWRYSLLVRPLARWR